MEAHGVVQPLTGVRPVIVTPVPGLLLPGSQTAPCSPADCRSAELPMPDLNPRPTARDPSRGVRSQERGYRNLTGQGHRRARIEFANPSRYPGEDVARPTRVMAALCDGTEERAPSLGRRPEQLRGARRPTSAARPCARAPAEPRCVRTVIGCKPSLLALRDVVCEAPMPERVPTEVQVPVLGREEGRMIDDCLQKLRVFGDTLEPGPVGSPGELRRGQ